MHNVPGVRKGLGDGKMGIGTPWVKRLQRCGKNVEKQWGNSVSENDHHFWRVFHIVWVCIQAGNPAKMVEEKKREEYGHVPKPAEPLQDIWGLSPKTQRQFEKCQEAI